MYCGWCGTENNRNAKLCARCGRILYENGGQKENDCVKCNQSGAISHISGAQKSVMDVDSAKYSGKKDAKKKAVLLSLLFLFVVFAAFLGIQAYRVNVACNEYETILEKISMIERKYCIESEESVSLNDANQLLEEVAAYAKEEFEEGTITEYAYKEGDTAVYFELQGWLGCIYQPSIQDVLSNNKEKTKIVTVEPFAYEIGTIISKARDIMSEKGSSLMGSLSASQQIKDITYGDVKVNVLTNDTTGKIDSILMSFQASMSYQGYDAEAEYEVKYKFNEIQ